MHEWPVLDHRNAFFLRGPVTVTEASGYVFDGNDARLDELREQYEAAAGRGLAVEHEIAAVLLKAAVNAHPLHKCFRFRRVKLPAASGTFGQFAPLDQSFSYFISAANKLLVFTGLVIRAKI
jgi:hypothetical protein